MNQKINESYDKDTDTFYVSFGTGEPSYVKELDDVLLLELGIYSNLPTGFRILGFKEHKIARVDIELKVFKKIENDLKQTALGVLAQRSKALQRELRTLATA